MAARAKRPRQLLLLIWSAAGFLAVMLRHPGAGRPALVVPRFGSFSGQGAPAPRTAMWGRGRPGSSTQVIVHRNPFFKPSPLHHVTDKYALVKRPTGYDRPPGPLRKLHLNGTMEDTLRFHTGPDGPTDPGQRLRGYYGAQTRAYLAELDSTGGLGAEGNPVGASVFWDFDHLALVKVYDVPAKEVISRTLGWVGSMVGVPVSRVEVCEFSKQRLSQDELMMGDGRLNWFMTMRTMGAAVHRLWPPMNDFADKAVWDQLNRAIAAGDTSRMLVLMTEKRGFDGMLQKAQKSGFTAVRIGQYGEAWIFLPDRDFSVSFKITTWKVIRAKISEMKRWQGYRPEIGKDLELGMGRFSTGPLAPHLLPLADGDELCLQRVHEWEQKYLPEPTRISSWKRLGHRLNSTVRSCLREVLEEDPERPEIAAAPGRREALEAHLAGPCPWPAGATVAWDHGSMNFTQAGPVPRELVSRFLRWIEGVVEAPVRRAEVGLWQSRALDSLPLNWNDAMKSVGMITHNIYGRINEDFNSSRLIVDGLNVRWYSPSKGLAIDEVDDALIDRMDVLVEEMAARGGDDEAQLLFFVSDEVGYRRVLKRAQELGITAVRLGAQGGRYYPGGLDFSVPLRLPSWKRLFGSDGLPFRLRPPHAPDGTRADPQWGRPDELGLDDSEPAPLRQVPQQGVDFEVPDPVYR